MTAEGWFAARPSGTENIYKVYAESFKDESHLQQIVNEARDIVSTALTGAEGIGHPRDATFWAHGCH